jgi:hypothetical protein
MLGSLLRSRMKDRACMKYEMTAPKTAIVRSASPTAEPAGKFHSNSARPYPTTAPRINATQGVFRFPWVTDIQWGK